MTAACAGLAIAAVSAAAAAAPGSSPLRELKTHDGFSVDDRYVVFYRLGGDQIRIRDTKTRRSASYPTTCLPPGSDSFRRGYLLLDCSTRTQVSYKVLRVSNRHSTDVPDVPEGVGLSGVGRQWVAGGRQSSGGNDETVYLNWHTGEVRSEPGLYSPNPPRNLDDPRLRLRRPGGQRGDAFPRRRGPYVLTYTFDGPHARELRLHKGGKITLLSRCTQECQYAELIPGLVVWAERSVVRGYALPSGRRLRWPKRGSLFMPAVGGTAYELYITEFVEDPNETDNPASRTFVTRWRDALH